MAFSCEAARRRSKLSWYRGSGSSGRRAQRARERTRAVAEGGIRNERQPSSAATPVCVHRREDVRARDTAETLGIERGSKPAMQSRAAAEDRITALDKPAATWGSWRDAGACARARMVLPWTMRTRGCVASLVVAACAVSCHGPAVGQSGESPRQPTTRARPVGDAQRGVDASTLAPAVVETPRSAGGAEAVGGLEDRRVALGKYRAELTGWLNRRWNVRGFQTEPCEVVRGLQVRVEIDLEGRSVVLGRMISTTARKFSIDPVS
jgi:hypothetical protein